MGRRRRRIGRNALTDRQRGYLFGTKLSRTSTHNYRSEASRRGHDTRTRKEGMKQVASGVLDLSHPVASTVKAGKDIGVGTAKIIEPRKVRKSKIAKYIDVV